MQYTPPSSCVRVAGLTQATGLLCLHVIFAAGKSLEISVGESICRDFSHVSRDNSLVCIFQIPWILFSSINRPTQTGEREIKRSLQLVRCGKIMFLNHDWTIDSNSTLDMHSWSDVHWEKMLIHNSTTVLLQICLHTDMLTLQICWQIIGCTQLLAGTNSYVESRRPGTAWYN